MIMQDLPYHAKVQAFCTVTASKRQLCIECFQPLGESRYRVQIPRQQINDTWYTGLSTVCCSQECATQWLQSVTLNPDSNQSEQVEVKYPPITDTLPTQETRD